MTVRTVPRTVRLRSLAQEAQKLADDRREEGVRAEEEEGEQAGHDHHHDRGRHRLLAGRPDHLRGLGTDLPDEFAGGSLGHFCSLLLELGIEKRPAGARPAGLRVT